MKVTFGVPKLLYPYYSRPSQIVSLHNSSEFLTTVHVFVNMETTIFLDLLLLCWKWDKVIRLGCSAFLYNQIWSTFCAVFKNLGMSMVAFLACFWMFAGPGNAAYE